MKYKITNYKLPASPAGRRITNKFKKFNNKIYHLSFIIYHSPPGGAGQSILEVLIALTLIILFLSGVVIIQLFAVRNTIYSENKSTAAKLARQQLDRVKVVRDSAGIDSLSVCQSSCFINSQLTPVQGITPTGSFNQVVSMQTASVADCPPPDVTPTPVSYKVTAKIILKNAQSQVTPTPLVVLSSCITDWR